MSKASSHPWAASGEEVLAELGVTRARGLSAGEVAQRRERFGRNELRKVRARPALLILAQQYRSVLSALLAAAAVMSLAFRDWIEAVAILAVLVINGVIGFVTELRATRSVEALRKLGAAAATVRRDGAVTRVSAAELVPGDIVVVEGGDVVTADLRLLEASRLQANESTLTGESMPVGKSAEPVAADAPVVSRASMLFKGTEVTRGRAECAVVATGRQTELGQISELVAAAEEETTPLERRLNRLGQGLVWITLAVAALVVAMGILADKPMVLLVETAIALAVATVPEGLPILATIALARGMYFMARRNALVNRLSAVETLGATSVIFSDKTGTLTENRMAVSRVQVAAGERTAHDASPVVRRALEVVALCNKATTGEGGATGDPMEVALLEAAADAGIDREALLREHPEVREEAFDPELKMMATVHESADRFLVAVKGAPEAVLACAESERTDEGQVELTAERRESWQKSADRLAASGLRVLAVAHKQMHEVDKPVYRGLALLALVGLEDPPRPEVREAIASCRRAGVRVVMVTGDHPVTAAKIARDVGIVAAADVAVIGGAELDRAAELGDAERARLIGADVFARVSPAQKLALVALYQRAGQIVAMTGDGVNDAPALKKADIGVAMGLRGTDVARQAADMVLRDDRFSSIVAAIGQGRIIFSNIRAFVVYLLSCNLSEVLVIGLATAVRAPLPLLPLQILFLNLVTDVFPAFALGAGKGSPVAMQRPPRDPQEAIIARRHWLVIGYYGLVLTASTLVAFALALTVFDMPASRALSISFLTLGLGQLAHVFNMRPPSGAARGVVLANPYVWAAVALCVALLAGAVAVPQLSSILQLSAPDGIGVALVAGGSVSPLAFGWAARVVARRRRRR